MQILLLVRSADARASARPGFASWGTRKAGGVPKAGLGARRRAPCAGARAGRVSRSAFLRVFSRDAARDCCAEHFALLPPTQAAGPLREPAGRRFPDARAAGFLTPLAFGSLRAAACSGLRSPSARCARRPALGSARLRLAARGGLGMGGGVLRVAKAAACGDPLASLATRCATRARACLWRFLRGRRLRGRLEALLLDLL